MVTQKDPDTIVDYFPLQSCFWNVQWQVGEMIDPLAAGKDFFLNFQGFAFVWKQHFGVCLLLILHK